jgi:hypothetical protein
MEKLDILVVTFSCSNAVHLFTKNGCIRPTLPYKTHRTVENAKEYLKEERCIDNPKILTR